MNQECGYDFTTHYTSITYDSGDRGVRSVPGISHGGGTVTNFSAFYLELLISLLFHVYQLARISAVRNVSHS